MPVKKRIEIVFKKEEVLRSKLDVFVGFSEIDATALISIVLGLLLLHRLLLPCFGIEAYSEIIFEILSRLQRQHKMVESLAASKEDLIFARFLEFQIVHDQSP
jgi:hypothetical protein